MKGYHGKMLRVNLTQSRISEESPPEEYYKLYLGGRGFIIHTLLKETPRGIDALSPENKIIFAARPAGSASEVKSLVACLIAK